MKNSKAFLNSFKTKYMVGIRPSEANCSHVSNVYVKAFGLQDAMNRVDAAVDHLDYIVKDVYGSPWDFDKNHQVVFIDCVHEYDFVKRDILNAINYFNKPLLFFDDYGLFPNTVMQCINELVDAGTLRIIKITEHTENVSL